MSKLNLDGHLIDVNILALYTWAMGEIVGPVEIVGGVFLYQLRGLSKTGIPGFVTLLKRSLSNLKSNLKTIDEARISSSIIKILPGYEAFISDAMIAVNWQKKHVDHALQAPQSTANLELPSWVSHHEYQRLLKSASDSLSEYLNGLEFSVQNIREIAAEIDDPPYLGMLDRAEGSIKVLRSVIDNGLSETVKKLGDQYSRAA